MVAADRIATLLPAVFQQTLRGDGPMDALLSVMEELHRPSEAALANLEQTIDPLGAPLPFVNMLMGWVGLGFLASTPQGRSSSLPPTSAGRPPRVSPDRMRLLIATAGRLGKRRGTLWGLRSLLRVATGDQAIEIEESIDQAFHFIVYAPRRLDVDAGLLRLFIESEKPAFASYELQFPEEPAPPREPTLS